MQAVSVDVKPGPAALNNAPARAPQLENSGIWQAAPTLVSGASAYRKGEFLYQDWIYDDRGAGTNAPNGPTQNARTGRYTYPTDVGTYYENLADIVEVRLKLTPADTAFRVTFNSMSNPALVGTTIALGGTAGVLRTVPFGANAVEPADVFITVRGATATVTDAATGATLSTLAAAVDYDRRQVEVRLPFATYDPRGKTSVRVAAATGLWNSTGNTYLIPAATATQTTPGGSGTNVANPPAFFNVAYRYTEPTPDLSTFTRWRDGVQASVLATTTTINGVATHDLSSFAATVDFVKLASGVDDDMVGTATGVPKAGFTNRIYSASYETVQGVANPAAPNLMKSQGCTPTSLRSADGLASCAPTFAGRLQQYSLFIPAKVPPATGYGLVTDLHGAGDNYNRNPPVTVERTMSLAERGTGSLVYITEGRGGAYWWWGQAGAEIWEVMADIKRNFSVDSDQVIASGISQGGYSTWKQTTMFPDLYAAAVPHVPCPSAGTGYNGTNAPGGSDSFAYPMIDSLRNLPVMASAGEGDTTCAWLGAFGNQAIRAKLDSLNYAYEFWSFLNPGHIFAMPACAHVSSDTTVAGVSTAPCGYSFEADYLDRLVGAGNPVKRVTNPPRVTYSVNAGWQEPLFNLVGDHAYWLSGVTVRDAAASPYGTVDVTSHGFGLGEPAATGAKVAGADYALGNATYNHNYNKWTKALGPRPAEAARNEVDVVATNIRKVVIDGVRARLDCSAKVNLQSDGLTTVVIHGCLKGDASLNDAIDCSDVAIAKSLSGVRRGDSRYDTRVDMNDDGLIDAADADAITKLLPAGTTCQ